jgi:hypothetical protein
MLRRILAATVLMASAPLGFANDNAATQQLLDMAHKPADLFVKTTEPFELRVEFTTQLGTPMHGQLLVEWKAKDEWWSKAIFGPFQQVKIRKGEEEYSLRNAGFTPLAVQDVYGLLQLADLPVGFIAKKQVQKIENGVALACIKAERGDIKSEENEFCVDTASHNVVSHEWWGTNESRNKRLYSDFQDFEGVGYARQLKLIVNQRPAISVAITKLQAAPFDAAWLIPPPGSIERRHCLGLKPAMPLKTLPLVQPATPSTGSAAFSLTVLADGSVSDVHNIGGREPANDPAIEALKKWKFKPAMCGTEPIVSDLELVLNSQHY